MKSFFAALQFLTVIPFPFSWGGGEKELGRSVWFFPVVGLVIGILLAGFDWGVGHLLPSFPASVLAVLFLLGISGGLHLDGLADTADGFLSSRPKERILEIMKDSRTGPMGAAAIVMSLLLKVALFTALAGTLRWRMLLMAPLAGRCALVTLMAVLPYAKAEGGLGSVFLKSKSPLNAAWALVVLLGVGWFAASWAGLVAGFASFVVTLLFAGHCYRKIGGLTGDTLGAASEIAELVPPLVGAIWIFRGGMV